MYIIEYIIFQCNDNQSLEERHTPSHETLCIIAYSMEQSPS